MKHVSLTCKLSAIAAFMAALTGCSNVDVIDDVRTDRPVVFSAFTDVRTKAEITSVSDLASEGGFLVWGFSTDTAKAKKNWAVPGTIFTEQHVTYDTKDNVWEYTPVKYWNEASLYCFYAVAPYKPSFTPVTWSLEGKGDAKLFTINNVGSAKAGTSDDILVCRGGVRNVRGADKTAQINFTFNHIMSKVAVKVKRSDKLDPKISLTITSLKMTGWNKENGNFVQNDSRPSGIECSEWSFATTSTQGGTAIFIGTDGNKPAADLTVSLTPTDSEKTLSDTYIVVPQNFTVTAPATATSLTFETVYTLSYQASDNDGKAYTETFNVKRQFPAAHCWGTDAQTTYTLTIEPKSIGLSAASTSWSESTLAEIQIQ